MKKPSAKQGPPQIGKTVQRLRQAYNLSLGDLSEQSGVAKSIISQIERNETNPTLATMWRLSQALDARIEDMLRSDDRAPFIEHAKTAAIPRLASQDGLCELRIIGSLSVVEWLQWYWFEAKPGGVLESEPHPLGTVENLSIVEGQLEVTVAGEVKTAGAGETLRYRGDLEHMIRNLGDSPAKAVMVNIVRAAG